MQMVHLLQTELVEQPKPHLFFMLSGTNNSIVWAPFAYRAEVNGTKEQPLGFVSGVDATTQYTSASATTYGLISNDNTS